MQVRVLLCLRTQTHPRTGHGSTQTCTRGTMSTHVCRGESGHTHLQVSSCSEPQPSSPAAPWCSKCHLNSFSMCPGLEAFKSLPKSSPLLPLMPRYHRLTLPVPALPAEQAACAPAVLEYCQLCPRHPGCLGRAQGVQLGRTNSLKGWTCRQPRLSQAARSSWKLAPGAREQVLESCTGEPS